MWWPSFGFPIAQVLPAPLSDVIEISQSSVSEIISEISTALGAVIIHPYIFPQEQGSRATIPGSSSLISCLQAFYFLDRYRYL